MAAPRAAGRRAPGIVAMAVVAGGIMVAAVVWMQRETRAPEAAERGAPAGPAGMVVAPAPVTVPAAPVAPAPQSPPTPVAPGTGEASAAVSAAAASGAAERPAASTHGDEAAARLRANVRRGPMMRAQTAAMPGVQFPARLPGAKLPPRGGARPNEIQ